MKGSTLLLLSGLLAGAIATPVSHGHVVHEKRDTTHPRWTKRSALHGDTNVPVRIALKQRNLERGMDFLMDVSDPKSKRYGQHYNKEQVRELFAPEETSVNAVREWLVESGIDARSINVPESGGWIQFNARASQLESILQTRYHVYDHVESRREHIGTDKYHLPRDIAGHVDYITPGVVFASRSVPSHKRSAKQNDLAQREAGHHGIGARMKPLPQEMVELLASSPDDLSNCSKAISPACIRAMYNIPAATKHDPSNVMGMFEDGDVYVQSDLDTYFAKYSPNIPKGTKPVLRSVNGAKAPGAVGAAEGEADLDFEMAWPLIYPQGMQLYQVDTGNTNDIFDTFLDAIDGSYCTYDGGDNPSVDGKTPNEDCGTFKPANVISYSYGTAEADYPAAYLQRQCHEFMKLGLQGSTMVIASGDDGVARRSGPCLGPKKNIFTPNTPTDCPYVTAVGATILPAGGKPGDAEIATQEFSSGGGFSNIFTTPSYQADAVKTYLSAHNPGYPSYNTSNGKIPTSGGIYNRQGRGYPDVSAVGDFGLVEVNGQAGTSGGTSMATPIFAAIINLIVEERIAAGKGPLGFINPTLYQNPSMFNDVTVGDQSKGGPNGDGEPSACGNKGFSAVEGWDPVTGLGTPKYPEMLKVFMAQ